MTTTTTTTTMTTTTQAKINFKVGDIVTLTPEFSEGDSEPYEIMEWNGDRGYITYLNPLPCLPLAPWELVRENMIQIAPMID